MPRSRPAASASISSRETGPTASGRSGRLYITDEAFQADNLTDEVKLGGVGGGAPIQNIKDYGFEVGGPIMRGKLWYWGSYSKQDIKAGIPGFLPDANCQAMKAALRLDPLAPIATEDVRECPEPMERN